MELSKHNHYVPQMSLNNWANEGKVYEYNLLVSNDKVPIWSRKSIKNIASIDYLYINIKDEKELDNIEKDFNIRFETPATEPLAKIVAGERLNHNEWEIVADYASAQYVRTPSFFFWIQNLAKNILPGELDDLARKINELKLDEIKNIKREDIKVNNADLLPITVRNTGVKADDTHTFIEIGFTVGKSIWFFSMIRALEEGSALRESLKSLNWSVVYAPEGVQWPTCDNPVVILKYINNYASYLSDGILADNNIIILPISPETVIVGSKARRFGRRFRAPNDFAVIIKNAIIANAFRYIYSSYEDEEIVKTRKRVVNLEEYNRLKKEFDNWYNKYKDIEVPILNERTN